MEVYVLVLRVRKVLSFCLILLMGNAGASSSTMPFEDPIPLRDRKSLTDFIVISQALVQELHGSLKAENETDTLIKLMAELRSKQRSVDFLNAFKRNKDICINTVADHPVLICKGGSAMTGYGPRSNIQMDFVYNSRNEAIGFHMSFYPINVMGCTTLDLILEGYIPFETSFASAFQGQDPRQFNQVAGENTMLVAHALGLGPIADPSMRFYDEAASQKVRQFLGHTQNLESFFMQTAQERCGNFESNAYDAYLYQFLEWLGIDPNDDREFYGPDAIDGTKLSSYRNYWKDRQNAFMGLLRRAEQKSKSESFQRSCRWLMSLIEFNPFNIRM